MPAIGLLLPGLIITLAAPASAEVMDKELAPSDVSSALAAGLLLALPAAAVHRWLLLPLFIFGPVHQLADAWTEWHDPFVGPALALEAGPTYGWLADGAMGTAVVSYLALWMVSSRVRHRLREPRDDLRFAIGLFGAVVLHAVRGFSVTAGAFLSIPTALSAMGLLVAAARSKTARLPRA
jgi:hypothetical protein